MKCVLHIGTEKTGTTLLQDWLDENRAILSASGVALATVPGRLNSRKLVSFITGDFDDYLLAHGVLTERERDVFFAGFEEAFEAEVSGFRADHDTVVLTSEHFHSRLQSPADLAKLANLLGRVFEQTEVVCYFREQSRVRTSLYSTALKLGSTMRLDEFENAVSIRSHYYNYFDFFRKWEDAFGFEALRPRLFDKAHLLDGDLRADFASVAFPQVAREKLSFKTVSANESLSASQAGLFRVVNQAHPRYIAKDPNPLATALKTNLMEVEGFKSRARLSDPRAKAMFAQFDTCNRAFFFRYFGRDENLFEPPEDTGTSEVPFVVVTGEKSHPKRASHDQEGLF